jgi:adenylate cyclase
MPIRPRLRHLPSLSALLVLVLLISVQIRFPSSFAAARHLVFDAYMRAHPAPMDAPITVISIDETSLERYGPWPWPEPRLSALVDELRALGASMVGLALIPAGPLHAERLPAAPGTSSTTKHQPRDSAWQASLASLPSVVGFALTARAGSDRPPPRQAGLMTVGATSPQLSTSLPKSLLPSANSLEGAAGIGALNVFPDPDGRVRRIPLLVQRGDRLYPSLVAELLRLRLGANAYLLRAKPGKDIDAPMLLKVGQQVTRLTGNGEIWLHYAPRKALARISAITLLQRNLPAGTLKDRIALIGVSAPGVGAMITSPLGEQLAPAEVHAQALAQLMAGSQPWRPSWASAAEVTFAAAGALLLIGISLRRRGLWLVVPGALLVATVVATAFQLFVQQRLLLDPLSPVLTITAVYIALALSSYLVAERERRWVQRAFSSYLSPNLVRHLMRDPTQLNLGGERRQCSFIMTDLAGFTPLVERSEPEALVDLLNQYLDRLVEVVFAHQGTLDRIVGDAVSVRFSAPVVQPDHAQRAVDCALALDRSAHGFAEEMRMAGIPFGETRIGVHSGEVIVGNFGGTRHLDYRAFGDPINTAARLETANKRFGTRLILSAATLGYCPNPPATRPIGELVLKGKARPIASFTPLTQSEIDSGLAETYSRAYAAMANQDDDATALIEACATQFPDDSLTAFHLQRLKAGGTGVIFTL